MQLKKAIIILFLPLLSLSLYAQQNESYMAIVQAESRLKAMFDELYNLDVPGDKLKLYKEIDSVFRESLKLPGSMNFAWKKLDKIGKLKSDDGTLKVFSWLYMISREEYLYTAYLQVIGKKDEVEVIKFLPGEGENFRSEDFVQKIDNWHPKVYYELITTEYKRKQFYTLLGADFMNSKSSMKTIEVLSFKKGKPVFRQDMFLDEGTVKDRMVLEYSADVAASVSYNKQLNMVVFDHLVPLHPLYHGYYQFYGPDGSYDGLKFVEGIWVRENDVDARNYQ